jgi:hypothetical protein
MGADLGEVACDLLHGGTRPEMTRRCSGLARPAGTYAASKSRLELELMLAGLAAVLIVPTGQHLMANILNASRYGRIGALDG